jgi:hypothetical protein
MNRSGTANPTCQELSSLDTPEDTQIMLSVVTTNDKSTEVKAYQCTVGINFGNTSIHVVDVNQRTVKHAIRQIAELSNVALIRRAKDATYVGVVGAGCSDGSALSQQSNLRRRQSCQ